jgi:2-iminobutanoate/2-iminopropanoate deaminase
MTRQAFQAPAATSIGPYSHAIESGSLVFLSGQTPIDPPSGKLVEGDIRVQTEQCFRNLFSVLDAAGLSPDQVIKVNVYLADMADFSAMNEAYMKQFSPPYPARTTIAVAGLPLAARIEIEMIASRG